MAFDKQILLSYIERLERLYNDEAAVAEGIKDVFNEAKSAGFDPKYIRKVLALRKLDPDELDEMDELTAMYRQAVGL